MPLALAAPPAAETAANPSDRRPSRRAGSVRSFSFAFPGSAADAFPAGVKRRTKPSSASTRRTLIRLARATTKSTTPAMPAITCPTSANPHQNHATKWTYQKHLRASCTERLSFWIFVIWPNAQPTLCILSVLPLGNWRSGLIERVEEIPPKLEVPAFAEMELLRE